MPVAPEGAEGEAAALVVPVEAGADVLVSPASSGRYTFRFYRSAGPKIDECRIAQVDEICRNYKIVVKRFGVIYRV